MRSTRRNARYLPEVVLPPALQIGADFDAALRHARGGVVVIATPMAGARAAAAPPAARRSTPPCSGCARASRTATGALGHEIARAVCADGARRRALRAELRDRGRARPADRAGRGERRRRRCAPPRSPPSTRASLRIYTSADPVGVEVGGAVKNVLAIATGIADGMGLGLNARAALITRGLAEMTRLGVALGAERRDLHGPVGPRRPGAHRDRRPVAQPHASASELAAGHGARRASSPSSATSPKACAARRWCCARAARARRRDADRRRRGRGARRRGSRPTHALEQLMRREARAGVAAARAQADAGVAVLAPGLEHRDRDRVAEVEAALAGAHRQAHRAARRERSRAPRPAGRRSRRRRRASRRRCQATSAKRAAAVGREREQAIAASARAVATNAGHDACRRTSAYS